MKKPFINKIPNILFFLFLFLFCLTIVGIIIGNKTPVAKDEFPPFSGLVVDEANIFTQRQKEELENILMQADPYQVVAVSLNSLRNKEIEEYETDSHQNRVLFFYENIFINTVMINFVPALISLITGSLSLYFMILVILVVVIHIPTYKRWKRDPKFPYKRQLLTDYRYDKKRKTWVSSSSHSSGSHHSSHSSGHWGGGGSFGGGGSSGRW